MASASMDVVRKILIFLVITAGIIMIGRWVPNILPKPKPADKALPVTGIPEVLPDSTNALPAVIEDTTGGKWQQKLFTPLLETYGLPDKHLKPKKGFFEILLPKGQPIHEYALEIERLCRKNEITVEQGVELHPGGQSIEYLLQSNGQHIKLRASLGGAPRAGSAKLALIFIEIDSLQEKELAELESADWDKTVVVNAYSPNDILKKLRYTSARNEILLELPMEPSNYPYVDPGKHALFIHHSREDVSKILSEGFDSLPKALGFATKYGDRAIENLPLLDKVFQYAAAKNLVFLDLTTSQRSLARQSATAQGARCRRLQPFRDLAHVDEELTRRAIQAQKTGESILVLPYSSAGFADLEKALAANSERLKEVGIELVTYSDLLENADEETPIIMPAKAPTKLTPKPAAKLPVKVAAKAPSKPAAKKPVKARAKPPAKSKKS